MAWSFLAGAPKPVLTETNNLHSKTIGFYQVYSLCQHNYICYHTSGSMVMLISFLSANYWSQSAQVLVPQPNKTKLPLQVLPVAVGKSEKYKVQIT